MSTGPAKNVDVEEERRGQVAEMEADHGPEWAEPYRPGSFGCHELLDRASMVGDILEKFVLSHPACLQNPHWYALAEQAASALRELYQRVGAEHMEAPGPPADKEAR